MRTSSWAASPKVMASWRCSPVEVTWTRVADHIPWSTNRATAAINQELAQTIYASNGHTFMYVAGLRFDTVALAQTGSRWSDQPANEPDLASFAVRHPPGL